MDYIKLFLTSAIVLASGIFARSQDIEFDKKIEIGNGLYKVETNDRWGIIDQNGKLILSAEHNEPVVVDGKAVISKYGTNQLVGIMNAGGVLTPTPQYFINPQFPFVADGMLAVRESPTGKWGFLNTETGAMLSVKIKGMKPGKDKALKSLGINGKNLEGDFVFDFVAPYSDGVAAVYAERIGWLHIDKAGNQRFVNPNGRPALFRSSIYDGKSLIFDDRGFLVCMETPDNKSGVVMFIDDNAGLNGYSVNTQPPYTFRNNGYVLSLNDRFQADKLVLPNGDSIIYIERKAPVVIEDVDTVAVIEEITTSVNDIRVTLARKSVSANSKGTATVTFNITNNSGATAGNLSVTINVQGSTKQWSGDLDPGATQQLSVTVPARFSAPAVSKKATWTVKLDGETSNGSATVSIARYKPQRR